MAKRVDENQKEIVAAARGMGASVLILSDMGRGCPDLMVGMFCRNFLWEVKNGKRPPSGQKLTEPEQKFFDGWKGQVNIINSVDAATNFLSTVIKEHTT